LRKSSSDWRAFAPQEDFGCSRAADANRYGARCRDERRHPDPTNQKYRHAAGGENRASDDRRTLDSFGQEEKVSISPG
jgi:hypothetical protein